MRRLGLIGLLSLILLVSGCGTVFIGGSFNPYTQTASGVISFVQVTLVWNGNVSTQVTVVTLVNSSTRSNFTFCGDQQEQFPMNNFATATFNPGQPCSTLLTVVIHFS